MTLETELLAPFKIFLFFFFSVSIFGQTFPQKEVDKLLNKGIENLLNQNYDSADSTFQILEKEFPNLPFGNIYLAANSITKSIDYGEMFDDKYITQNLESAVKISERKLDQNENDIWNNYFAAISKGFLAYYLALNEDYIEAFAQGYFSISFFERCENLENNFYESKIAIGTFLYWKSEKADWLPFIGDEKGKGIKYLEEAVKHKSYNYYSAVNSLIWIYINEKEFAKAIEIAEAVLNRYPENRYFKWCLARAYEEINKEKAIEIYNNIFDSLSRINKLSIFNEIALKHKIAQLFERQSNFKTALKYCDEILSIKNIPADQFERLEERLERVKKQRDKLLILLNNH